MIKNIYWKNKKVIVTGAGGFVGSVFVKKLSELEAIVIPISKSNWSDLQNKITDVWAVFHCAAMDGNAKFKELYSQEILETNLKITKDILKTVKKNQIPQFFLLSSADVYPPAINEPIAENMFDVSKIEDSKNGYVLSKRQVEEMSIKAAKEHDFNLLILRPTNIYGVEDKKERLIPVLVKNIVTDKPIILLNNGKQKRNFIFVNDFVDIVIELAQKKQTGTFNIASSEVISLSELASLIGRLAKKKPSIISQSVDEKLTKDRIIDNSHLLSVLDFKFTSLEDGLMKVLQGSSSL